MYRRNNQFHGFALVDIVIISLIVLIILSSLLVIASNSFQGTYKDHYQRMAEEAAEAGTAYATSCLWQSSKVQTWGAAKSKPNLTPATDCNGQKTYNGNEYVFKEGNVRTYFVVPDLDMAADYGVQISSTGYTEILDSRGTVRKTYTSVLKKVMVWDANLDASTSASGAYRTCAILSGNIYCWGYGAYGQLGNGKYLGGNGRDIGLHHPEYDSKTPVKVKQEPGVLAGKVAQKIFTGLHHSCTLTTDGKMYCWGYNRQGQLGTGDTKDSPVPVEVKGALSGKTITDIGGSGETSCAIADGDIYCWGGNTRGVVGNGSYASAILSPVRLPTTGTATALALDGASSPTMCAIIDKRAWCWGSNYAGGVGVNDRRNHSYEIPTRVYDGGVLRHKDILTISQDGYQGEEHVCVVASDKRVYCWGSNFYGQIGDNSTQNRYAPVAVYTYGVMRNRDISEVRLGVRHSCALSGDDIFCWGYRDNGGQLGDNKTYPRISHIPVEVLKEPGKLKDVGIKHISAGMNRGCATTEDGRTFCWGRNLEGQIGDGTFENRAKPTEAIFLRPIANQYIY